MVLGPSKQQDANYKNNVNVFHRNAEQNHAPNVNIANVLQKYRKLNYLGTNSNKSKLYVQRK
jgi:hypothetical protein